LSADGWKHFFKWNKDFFQAVNPNGGGCNHFISASSEQRSVKRLITSNQHQQSSLIEKRTEYPRQALKMLLWCEQGTPSPTYPPLFPSFALITNKPQFVFSQRVVIVYLAHRPVRENPMPCLYLVYLSRYSRPGLKIAGFFPAFGQLLLPDTISSNLIPGFHLP
jgi:hypothetical protein